MVISKSSLNIYLVVGLIVCSSIHVWALLEVGVVLTGIEFSLFFASLLVLMNFQSGVSRSFLQFIFLFLLLQAVNAFSVLVNGNQAAAFVPIFKNIVYLILPVGLYLGLKHSRYTSHSRLYVISLVVFGIAVMYFGVQRSIDFGVFLRFLGGGSFSEVQHGFFHKLFDDYRLVRHEGASASAFRHGILYIFLSTFLLAKFYTRTSRKNVLKLDYKDAIIIVLNILFLSRQVLVCVFFYYFLLAFFYKKNIYFRFFLAFFLFVATFFFLGGFSFDVNENIYERLVYDVLNNPRLIDFSVALTSFSQNIFSGVGYGVPLESETFAHNLVISQLHQTGLLGGGVAFFLIVYLIKICFNSVVLFVKNKNGIYLVLACLTTIPVSKMLVGVAGDLDFASWFSIGVMFFVKEQSDNFMIKDKRERRVN